MSTLTTTNYGWQYPDSGGQVRPYADYATFLPQIDTSVKAIDTVASAALPANWQVFARRTTDGSVAVGGGVNNTTTLAGDDQMVIAPTVSAVYEVRVHLIYNSGATPGFKTQISLPSGWTANGWSFLVKGSGTAVATGLAGSSAAVSGIVGQGADATYDSWGLLISSATSGSVRVQFAQNTANASDTLLKAGSYISARRVA